MSAYRESDWDAESQALLEGAKPAACPECGLTGFYGPRRGSPEEKYRMCTFCGFRQRVSGPAERWRAVAHRCESWPEVAGAPYVEWMDPQEREHRCPFCAATVDVERAAVPRPVDDPEHPWRKVPQGMSPVDALTFWRGKLESSLPINSRLYL